MGIIPEIVYSARTDDVDWVALKAALVAGDFDNERTAEEYRRSHENSHAVIFARGAAEYIGNGRILSDGVCNAYLVDIWTAPQYRRAGIGSEIVRRLVATVPGQHVALFTEDRAEFYRTLGFADQHGGMSQVSGRWLNRPITPS
ncbi:MAG: GCN5-related N-acetyltransferase [Frankiales bacterium]|nr:GCN5-related N-acetyltransferase [Frankiales bacterium]